MIVHFAEAIKYDGEDTRLIIGIASNSDDHIEILQELDNKIIR